MTAASARSWRVILWVGGIIEKKRKALKIHRTLAQKGTPHHLHSEHGIVDVLLDELLQRRIAPLLPLVPLRLRQHADAITTSSLHDLAGDDQAGVADALDARVDEALVDLVGIERAGEGGGRRVDHVVGDAAGLGEDGAEADAGEDVDVVALVGVVGDGLGAVAGFGGEGGKGRPRGEDDGAVGPGHGLLEGALGLGEGVAEREEDGAAAEAAGVDRGFEGAHDGLGEDAKGGGQADEGGGLDVLDDFLEGAELVAVVVDTRKVLLVLGKLVAAVLGHEALGVDEPELVARGLLREAALGVVLHQLLGDADAGGAGAHEHEALLLDGDSGEVDGANVPAGLEVSKGNRGVGHVGLGVTPTYPPRTTAPVPWMSSLKHLYLLR